MRALLLADNQDITKAGIFYFCEGMGGFGPVGEAVGRKELLQQLSASPDAVVILDYTLFDLAGADELLILQERFHRAHWILFSEDLSEEFIRRVLFSSQSCSIVMKDASQDEIRSALQAALRSERFICRRIRNLLDNCKVVREVKERPVLTTTETEILKAIALGKTTKEIAAERFSSIHTITTHRKNIFRKLEVNNIHEATKYALRAGIVNSAEYYI